MNNSETHALMETIAKIRKIGEHEYDLDRSALDYVLAPGEALTVELARAPAAEANAGEAWMNGTLTVEDGSLYDFLDLFGRNLGTAGLKSFKSPLRHIKRMKRGYHRLNDRWRSERNVPTTTTCPTTSSHCSSIHRGPIAAPTSSVRT